MSLPCVRFVIATVLLGAVSWSAPDPSVQLRELNNDLLQIHADIERGPSRAAALRAQAAIVLEERTAALELLIAQDARIALSFAFPPEVLARLSAAFPGSASALESHGTWEGELQYLIFDDAALTMHSSLRRLRSGRDMLHVYFIGSEPENLKSGDHLRVTGVRVGSIVIAQDARVEPAAAGAACSTTGQQNTAVLLVAFPDTIPPGISPATVYDIFFSRSALSLTNFWREASQGKTWAAGDVFGWYTLDRAYTCDEYMEMRAAAIRAAAAHVDFQQYQRIVVVFPSTGNCRWAALASFGCNTISSPTDGDFTASSAWLAASEISRRDQGVKLAVHMGGHNLTLSHASALNDPQSGLRNLPQYSAPDKVRVGWLDSETNIQTVESSGVFTLNPSQRNSARIQALKVRRGRGDDASLWIEYFQPASSSSIADVGQSYSGVLIRYDEAGTLKTELIGIPSEPPSSMNAALRVSKTWVDQYSNLSLDVQSAGPDAVKIAVTYGSVPCVRVDPTVTLSPPNAGAVVEGSNLTYTVAVTNNDSSGCPPSVFSLTSTSPAWVSSIDGSTLILAPGESQIATLNNLPAPGTSPGTYTLETIASDGTRTGRAAANGTITVSSPIVKSDRVTSELATVPAGSRLSADSSASTETSSIVAPQSGLSLSNIRIAAKSHTWAQIFWNTTVNASRSYVMFGTSTPPTMRTYDWVASSTRHVITIGALKPNTTYYYKVCSTASFQVCSSVSTFITNPAPADRFRNPTLPTINPLPGFPSTYNVTYNITSCGQIDSTLAAIAAENMPDKNYRLILPNNLECYFTDKIYLRNRAPGTGFVDIVSKRVVDGELPAGVRMDEARWGGKLPKLILSSGISPLIAGGSQTPRRYRLVGLDLGVRGNPNAAATICGMRPLSTQIEITTCAPHGYSVNDIVVLWNLKGVAPARFSKAKIRSIPSPTKFLFNGAFTGTWTGGGWHLKNKAVGYSLFHSYAATAMEQIIFDRNIIQAKFPMRAGGLIATGDCRDCAVVNNDMLLESWHLVDPDTGSLKSSLLQGQTVSFTRAKRLRIENNRHRGVGILLFSEGGGNDQNLTHDILIRRNLFEQPLYQKLNDPASDGLLYAGRHAIQCKSCNRIAVTGNVFRQQYAPAYSTIAQWNAPIVLTPRDTRTVSGPTLNQIADVTITDNLFEKTNGFVAISGGETPDGYDTQRTRRILIRNNVLLEFDGRYLAEPSRSSFNGWVFYLNRGPEDLVIDHNTVWNPRGGAPSIFTFMGERGGGFRFTNNLIGVNSSSSTIWYSAGGTYSNYTPQLDYSNRVNWLRDFWRQLPDPGMDSASLFAGNTFIPGVTNSSMDAYYDNPAYNWSRTACETYFGALLPRNSCFGGTETTGNQRLTAARFSNADLGLYPDSPILYAPRITTDGLPPGANGQRVAQEIAKVDKVRVTSIGPGTATIVWEAYSGETCHSVDWTANNWVTYTRVLNTSIGRFGAQQLTGLGTGQLEARINCSTSQPAIKWVGTAIVGGIGR